MSTPAETQSETNPPADAAAERSGKAGAETGTGAGAGAARPVADQPLRAEDLHALLADKRQPTPPGALASVRATTWRSMLKIKHTPEQMFDVTMFPIIMVLLFTFLFGGAIAGSRQEYVRYLVPGIMTMSVLLTTIYTGMTLHIDLRTGVFDRFRTLPIWRPAPVVGYLVADAFRYTIASACILAVGMLLGYRPGGGVLGVVAGIVALLVFAFAASWAWTALGITVNSEKTISAVSMAVLFPLCFLSNVLVQPSTLPGWLQAFVKVSPITQAVTTVRSLMDGKFEPAAAAWTAGYAVLFLVVFGSLTLRAYNRR